MRIVTQNVEWVANLFVDDDRLSDDDGCSSHWEATDAVQIAAPGRVFRALDADAVMAI